MKSLLIVLIVGCTIGSCVQPSLHKVPTAELVIAWNERIMQTAVAEDGLLTLKGVRTVSMAHLAMHDALSSIYRRYEPYLHINPQSNADPLIAANQAAYAIAINQYPNHADAFAALYNQWGEAVDENAKEAGLQLGDEVAHAILDHRRDDGWNTEAAYQWHPMGPGVYAEFNEHSGTPEGFIFGAGWGKARPFMMKSPDQFVSPPPPAIESNEYVAHFEEVKMVGAFESSERTADQTHLALWWKDFAENTHNRLARTLVAQENLDLVDATRMFALINTGVFDAYVSSFYNKFLYNHWRPYTAIRWAEHDGNPDTHPDTSWTNTHQHTYAFPSYPSAHGTACAAAMTAFEETFGEAYAFSMYTPFVDSAGPFSGKMEMNPPTRSFNSFSEAALECAMSRVYLGIHFRYDSIEGNELGKKVGKAGVDRLAERLD